MIRAARRPAAALLLLVAAVSSACSAWQVQPVAPEQLLGERPPSIVRLRLQDSTRLVLERPHLATDSVTGRSKGASTSVPLTAITEVAVRRFSAARTAGFVAGGAATLFLAAAVACAAQGGCGINFNGFTLGGY